jgi:hypothetical protein
MSKKEDVTVTVTYNDQLVDINDNMSTTITAVSDDFTVTHTPSPLNPDLDSKGKMDVMGLRTHNFLKSLLNPDMFGHAVTAEVRDEARKLLGMKTVETTNWDINEGV